MEALYSFVDDIENLPGKIKQLERTVVRILEQTTECGIFFREYTDHGFVGECVDSLTSSCPHLRNRSISRTGGVESQPDDHRPILDTDATQRGSQVGSGAAHCIRVYSNPRRG